MNEQPTPGEKKEKAIALMLAWARLRAESNSLRPGRCEQGDPETAPCWMGDEADTSDWCEPCKSRKAFVFAREATNRAHRRFLVAVTAMSKAEGRSEVVPS